MEMHSPSDAKSHSSFGPQHSVESEGSIHEHSHVHGLSDFLGTSPVYEIEKSNQKGLGLFVQKQTSVPEMLHEHKTPMSIVYSNKKAGDIMIQGLPLNTVGGKSAFQPKELNKLDFDKDVYMEF